MFVSESEELQSLVIIKKSKNKKVYTDFRPLATSESSLMNLNESNEQNRGN